MMPFQRENVEFSISSKSSTATATNTCKRGVRFIVIIEKLFKIRFVIEHAQMDHATGINERV